MKNTHTNLRPAIPPTSLSETEGRGSSRIVGRDKIERPNFVVTPLAEGLAWRGDGIHRFEEKLDGVTHIREVRAGGYTARLWGELLPGGQFYAVDVLERNGEDMRQWPRRESLRVLDAMTARLSLLRPAVGHGGEFLEMILAKNGEGVVASLLDAPFSATRWKCKRTETFRVVVLEKHAGGKSSVRVGSLPGLHGEVTRGDLGWLPLFGNKFDQCRVGSVLKVEGMGLTAAGKIREPRICRDSDNSWLVQI